MSSSRHGRGNNLSRAIAAELPSLSNSGSNSSTNHRSSQSAYGSDYALNPPSDRGALRYEGSYSPPRREREKAKDRDASNSTRFTSTSGYGYEQRPPSTLDRDPPSSSSSSPAHRDSHHHYRQHEPTSKHRSDDHHHHDTYLAAPKPSSKRSKREPATVVHNYPRSSDSEARSGRGEAWERKGSDKRYYKGSEWRS